MIAGAEFSHHERCPQCAQLGKDIAKDNLGVWKDGHKYCFSCGWKDNGPGLSLERLMARHQQIKLLEDKRENKKNGRVVSLPDDFTVDIPQTALEWLKSYEITDAEIEENWIGWSPQHERLIFPVFDKWNNLLMYSGRDFSARDGRPKYHTEGFPEKVFHVLNDDGDDCVCIVEDIVSAVKVSRVVPAMPLWGSILSTKRMITLSDIFKVLIIWLDHDKQEYALKQSIKARPFFDDVKVIGTDHDPKVFCTSNIKEILDHEFKPCC